MQFGRHVRSGQQGRGRAIAHRPGRERLDQRPASARGIAVRRQRERLPPQRPQLSGGRSGIVRIYLQQWRKLPVVTGHTTDIRSPLTPQERDDRRLCGEFAGIGVIYLTEQAGRTGTAPL